MGVLQLLLFGAVFDVQTCHFVGQFASRQRVRPQAGTVHAGKGAVVVAQSLVTPGHVGIERVAVRACSLLLQASVVLQGGGILLQHQPGFCPRLEVSSGGDGAWCRLGQQAVAHAEVLFQGIGLLVVPKAGQESAHAA